jgi:signal transduction histidine kinase
MGRESGEGSLAWLRVAVALAAVVPIVFVAVLAWFGHASATREAQRALADTARAAQEHAVRVMDRNDVVMQQMLRLLSDDSDARIRAREKQLHEVAMAILLRFPDIRSLSVWSADGKLLVSTLFFPVPRGLQRIDWDYFRWGQRTGEGASSSRGLAIEHASGERLLRAVKPRSPEERAGGEIELVFRPSQFDEAYGRLTKGSAGRGVAWVNAEGVIVGSWPSVAPTGMRLHAGSYLLQRMAAGAPSGTLTKDVFSPGDRRFAAFLKVGDHPLIVAAVQDEATILAGWRRQVLLLALISFPVTVALVMASWLALRRTRREIEARHRLREESKQRVLAEESLRHAHRLDALGQLAGGLAHDFNNLLAVVASSAELLAKVVPGAAARPELDASRRAAHRGTRLTRRLLASFRRQSLQPEAVAILPALDDMLEVLRTTAGAGITLSVDVDADTPAIEVDAAELEIALINLVANARDAMRHAGQIDIKARRVPGYAAISVTDGGEGMSAETLQRAFEPFFTTKPTGSGTGLGLSQVHRFCDQSAGSVKVSSELGVGTTVSMLLPASERQLPAELPPLAARVLVVQRAGNDASSPAAVLRNHGCVVTAARSMSEVERLVAAEKNRFDAVLICASGAEGEEAALVSRLHKREPGLPVVLLKNASSVPAAQLIGTLSKALSAHRPATHLH